MFNHISAFGTGLHQDLCILCICILCDNKNVSESFCWVAHILAFSMWVTGFKVSKECFWRNNFQMKTNFVHIFFLTFLSMINTVIGTFIIHIGNRRSITGGWSGMGLRVIYHCVYIRKFGILEKLLIICYTIYCHY